MRPYNRNLKYTARRLRKDMTPAERSLWARLRKKQIGGVQFYRQKILGNFIVDFYAPMAYLVIEVDGGQHRRSGHVEQDAHRDAFLRELGIEVLRFSNREVLKRADKVVEVIQRAVDERKKSPLDPPFH
jgi:very-short-patch-repair endonuclease